jgi:ferredoxin
MSKDNQRLVGDLTIRIDHDLCVGFAHCVEEAPGGFELDDDGLVRFDQPEAATRDELISACQVCPVEALVVIDAEGSQIVP